MFFHTSTLISLLLITLAQSSTMKITKYTRKLGFWIVILPRVSPLSIQSRTILSPHSHSTVATWTLYHGMPKANSGVRHQEEHYSTTWCPTRTRLANTWTWIINQQPNVSYALDASSPPKTPLLPASAATSNWTGQQLWYGVLSHDQGNRKNHLHCKKQQAQWRPDIRVYSEFCWYWTRERNLPIPCALVERGILEQVVPWKALTWEPGTSSAHSTKESWRTALNGEKFLPPPLKPHAGKLATVPQFCLLLSVR